MLEGCEGSPMCNLSVEEVNLYHVANVWWRVPGGTLISKQVGSPCLTFTGKKLANYVYLSVSSVLNGGIKSTFQEYFVFPQYTAFIMTLLP